MSEEQNYQERLKSGLWYSVGKIVDNEALSARPGEGINATPQFIAALTELAWQQLENTAKDLESFAHHANRSTISTEDVLLLGRRNDDLHQILKDFVRDDQEKRDREKEDAGTSKGKGKGKAVARGKAKK